MSKVTTEIQSLNQTNCELIAKLGNSQILLYRQIRLMMSPNITEMKNFNQELAQQVERKGTIVAQVVYQELA